MSDERTTIDRRTHVASGPHRGKPWHEIPESALQEMLRPGHPEAHRAERELKKREVQAGEIRLTRSAIENGSLACEHELWFARRVGIYTYLQQLAAEALAGGVTDELGRYIHEERQLAIEIHDVDVARIVYDITPALKKETHGNADATRET